MGTRGASQPTRNPGSHRKPPPGEHAITGANPTPIDAVFILFASVFLLLLLLWIATVLNGHELFTALPPWTRNVVEGIWSKVLLGTGTVGTLALRKWLYKSTVAPNYLLWIPGLTILLIGALFLVKPLLPPPMVFTHYHVPIHFAVEPVQTSDLKTEDDTVLWFKKRIPLPQENPVGLQPDPRNQSKVYSYYIDIPHSEREGFEAELNYNTILSYFDGKAPLAAEYLLCLHNNVTRSLPADASGSKAALIQVACGKSGHCKRTNDDPGYVQDCESSTGHDRGLLPVVHAASAEQVREPGWVVPSLHTLDETTDRERVGYTRFYMSFTPAGQAAEADQYYHILQVNGKPIYINGFLPDRTIYPVQRSTMNWISFALENLDFTGQYAGKEKLHLTVVFLKGGKEVYRQELERDYIALRPAEVIPPIKTEIGTFTWTGKYVVPKNENKYELFLGSSVSPDLAMNAKAEFDRLKFSINDRLAVMVVRPPLPKKHNPHYGMVVGLVTPTSQVQFTFNDEQTHNLCQWAAVHAGKGPGGRLIRPDYSRYEIAADKPVPCN